MNHVFISHCQADSKFARGCQRRLAEKGFETWRSNSIKGGNDWRREIDSAIKEAFALIVVISPESKTSEYVTYEWAFAWGAGIKVIPLLLKETEIHPRLESLQYLNFIVRRRPWDKLFELLDESRATKPEQPKTPSQDSVITKDAKKQKAYERMITALRDEKWTWRTVRKLAGIGGVSVPVASTLLIQDSNVVVAKNQKGEKIAKLRLR